MVKFIRQSKNTAYCVPVALYNYISLVSKGEYKPDLEELIEEMCTGKTTGTYLEFLLMAMKRIFHNFKIFSHVELNKVFEIIDRTPVILFTYSAVYGGGHATVVYRRGNQYFILNEGQVKKELTRKQIEYRVLNGFIIYTNYKYLTELK